MPAQLRRITGPLLKYTLVIRSNVSDVIANAVDINALSYNANYPRATARRRYQGR